MKMLFGALMVFFYTVLRDKHDREILLEQITLSGAYPEDSGGLKEQTRGGG